MVRVTHSWGWKPAITRTTFWPGALEVVVLSVVTGFVPGVLASTPRMAPDLAADGHR